MTPTPSSSKSPSKKPPVADPRKLRRMAWERERQHLFRYAVGNSGRKWFQKHNSPEEVHYYMNKWSKEDNDFCQFIQNAMGITSGHEVMLDNNCPGGASDQSPATENVVQLEVNIDSNDESLALKEMPTETENR